MKALSAGYLAALASPVAAFATCWKITRTDGAVYGFTDHDAPVVFGGMTYTGGSAFSPSSYTASATLAVDNMEVQGILNDSGTAGITIADLEAGRWDGAAFEIFQVNLADLSDTMGRNILSTGQVGIVNRTKGQYVAELRGLAAALSTNIGRTVLPTCDAVLGDARCGVNLSAYTDFALAITAVTSRMVVTMGALSHPDGYNNNGVLTGVTGANVGLKREVKTQVGTVLTLQLAFPFAIAVGDTFNISRGCNHLFKIGAGNYTGDCITIYNNGKRFRGCPEVPLANGSVRPSSM